VVNYEAQAAIELEALVDPDEENHYPFILGEDEIDPAPVIRAIVTDMRADLPVGRIAARFHNGVAIMVEHVCSQLRVQHGVSEVVLSGGVWQNMVLLTLAERLLRESDFTVYIHRKVPTNDGGLALGQAAVAANNLK
jgi:hydrogenase maturation protein HypF